MGPTEVGYHGTLQMIADLLKLLQKEETIPRGADRTIFRIAPFLIFCAIFSGFAVIPLSPAIIGSGIDSGVFFLLSVIGLDVIGLLMAGWASNSKYSLFGAMRAVAQIISYEIPVGLSVLSAVMICQSLNLQEIAFQQGIWYDEYSQGATNYFLGIKALGWDITNVGGFLTWNIFRSPFLFIAYIVFFISTLAECNRAPFDIPEAESELIAGYHTEYSGYGFSVFFLAEYGMMFLVSLLGAILFLGGWNTPFPNIGALTLADWTSGMPGTMAGNIWGMFWILIKAIGAMIIHIWIRWTFPRLRVDQLMYLCWKVLTPVALLLICLSGVWRMLMV